MIAVMSRRISRRGGGGRGLSFDEVIMNASPRAFMPLSQDRLDVSGNGCHSDGQALNGTTYTFDPEPLRPDALGHLRVEGTANIQIYSRFNGPAIGAQPFTVEMIIRPLAFVGQWAKLFSDYNENNGFGVVNGSVWFQCAGSGLAESTKGGMVVGETCLATGRYNGSNYQVFLNGVGGVVRTYAGASWGTGWFVRRNSQANVRISDAIIFDRALSDAEIMEHAVAAGVA